MVKTKRHHRKKRQVRRRKGFAAPRMQRYGTTLQYPFPANVRMNFRAAAWESIIATSAGPNGNAYEFQYQGNSIVNIGPNSNYPLGSLISGEVNNPAGLAQFLSSDDNTGLPAGIYRQYVVHASSFKVTLTTLGNGPTHTSPLSSPIGVIICPLPKAAVPDTLTNTSLMEQPGAKFLQITQFQNAKPLTIKMRATTRDVYGKNATMNDDDFVGIATKAPTRQWIWVLRTFNMDDSTSPYTLLATAEIIYDTKLFSRNFTKSTVIGVQNYQDGKVNTDGSDGLFIVDMSTINAGPTGPHEGDPEGPSGVHVPDYTIA